MEKEWHYECSHCGTAFTIITNSNEKPEVCPFCGNDLDNEMLVDGDEYEED